MRTHRHTAILLVCALAAVALASCGTLTSHDAVKLNGIAVNLNDKTGATAGQFSITIDRAPRFVPAGQAQDVVTACGQTDSPDTYSNLNSKATASASSLPVGVTAANATAANASIGSPSVAIATGDVTANGCAAIVAAATTSAHPADVVSAALNHTVLPSAPAGTIVRDGVAPPVPAPAAASTKPAS